MNDYDFYESNDNKNGLIKKAIVIFLITIAIILLTRACSNALTSRIREDVSNDNIENIVDKEESLDLDRKFSSFNINSNEDLCELISKIAVYLKPVELQKYINYDNYNYLNAWDNYENLNDFLKNWLPRQTYKNFLILLLNNKVDYDEAPLTEHFKEKFKDGFLIEYSDNDKNIFYLVEYDYYERIFAISLLNGLAEDYYYFNFILDEEGYLDDAIFSHVKHVLDEYGDKIPEIDKFLMDEEPNVKGIILWVCRPYEYGNRNANTDDWYHAYDKDIEFGLTDKFREFTKDMWSKQSILGYDDCEDFEIVSVDMENKSAIVKVELEDKYVYHDVFWTTDDNYRMDTIEAKINREEFK